MPQYVGTCKYFPCPSPNIPAKWPIYLLQKPGKSIPNRERILISGLLGFSFQGLKGWILNMATSLTKDTPGETTEVKKLMTSHYRFYYQCNLFSFCMFCLKNYYAPERRHKPASLTSKKRKTLVSRPLSVFSTANFR